MIIFTVIHLINKRKTEIWERYWKGKLVVKFIRNIAKNNSASRKFCCSQNSVELDQIRSLLDLRFGLSITYDIYYALQKMAYVKTYLFVSNVEFKNVEFCIYARKKKRSSGGWCVKDGARTAIVNRRRTGGKMSVDRCALQCPKGSESRVSRVCSI